MAAIVPNVGEIAALGVIFMADRYPKVHLYKSDQTPDESYDHTMFEQADFPGYGAYNLDPNPAIVTTASGRAKASWSNVEFLRTTGSGTQTIYGWYLTISDRDGSTALLMAKRFTTPVVIAAAGDKVAFDLDAFATEVSS